MRCRAFARGERGDPRFPGAQRSPGMPSRCSQTRRARLPVAPTSSVPCRALAMMYTSYCRFMAEWLRGRTGVVEWHACADVQRNHTEAPRLHCFPGRGAPAPRSGVHRDGALSSVIQAAGWPRDRRFAPPGEAQGGPSWKHNGWRRPGNTGHPFRFPGRAAIRGPPSGRTIVGGMVRAMHRQMVAGLVGGEIGDHRVPARKAVGARRHLPAGQRTVFRRGEQPQRLPAVQPRAAGPRLRIQDDEVEPGPPQIIARDQPRLTAADNDDVVGVPFLTHMSPVG